MNNESRVFIDKVLHYGIPKLAVVTGISANTINGWKRRGSVPQRRIKEVATKLNWQEFLDVKAKQNNAPKDYKPTAEKLICLNCPQRTCRGSCERYRREMRRLKK